MRFVEEVELLSVEMNRVLQFFQWQASWWRSIGDTWTHAPITSEMRREGLIGYANRQAAMRESLTAHFRRLWSTAPTVIAKAQAEMAVPLSNAVDGSGFPLVNVS
jgi:hypothetical protein